MGQTNTPNCCCMGPGWTRRDGVTSINQVWPTWILVEFLPVPFGTTPDRVPCWCADPFALKTLITVPAEPHDLLYFLQAPYTLLGYDQYRNDVIFYWPGPSDVSEIPNGGVWKLHLETCVGGSSTVTNLFDKAASDVILADAAGEEIYTAQWFGAYAEDADGGRLLGVAHTRVDEDIFTRIFSVKYDGTDFQLIDEIEGEVSPSHSEDRIYTCALNEDRISPIAATFPVGAKFGIPGQSYRFSWLPSVFSEGPSGLWFEGTDATEERDIYCAARDEQYGYQWYYFPFACGFDNKLQAACVYWYRNHIPALGDGEGEFEPGVDPPVDAEHLPPPYVASYWNQALSAGNIIGQAGVTWYLTSPVYGTGFGNVSHYGGQGPTVIIPGSMPLPLELDGETFVVPEPPEEFIPDCDTIAECEAAPLDGTLAMFMGTGGNRDGGIQTDGFSVPVNGQEYELMFEYKNLEGLYEMVEVEDVMDLPTALQSIYSANRYLFYAPIGEEGNYSNPGIRVIDYDYTDPLYQHEEYVYGVLIQFSCSDGEVYMPNPQFHFAYQRFRGHEGTVGSWPTYQGPEARTMVLATDPDTLEALTTPGVALECSSTTARAEYTLSFDIRDGALDPPIPNIILHGSIDNPISP